MINPTAKAWLLAIRPVTLTASIIPVILGDLSARVISNSVDWKLSLCALLSACSIQIGTNLYNDIVDFQTGADDKNRVGPKRLLVNEIATIKQVRFSANLSFLFAMLFGLPLVLHTGIPILVIGLISIVLGYGYSAPPLKLAYRGWSEAFVILFFGLIAVTGVSYIHLNVINFPSLLLGLIVGLLSTNLLVINNLRDIEGDKRVGKLTLAARFGAQFARREFYLSSFLAFVAAVLWSTQHSYAGLVVLLAFLPLIKVGKLILNDEKSKMALPLCAASHLCFGVLSALVLTIL
jgi:1,4-dihydroxy-2-naphthoate octaprenyltransferase